MSNQPTATAASDAKKAQALQGIIKRLGKARGCLPALSSQRFHSVALQDAMQGAFREALKWGAFKGPKWAGLYVVCANPNEPLLREVLMFAKDEEYVGVLCDSATIAEYPYKGVSDIVSRFAGEEEDVDGLWDSATRGDYPYKDLLDEASAQLIELLRQEAAAGAASPSGATGRVKQFLKKWSWLGKAYAAVKTLVDIVVGFVKWLHGL